MRDDDTGDPALARSADDPHDCLAVGGVERARGLVREQQPTFTDNRTRNGDALAFAAG